MPGCAWIDIDLIELNEAFASQAIACMRELDLDPARVNVYGGAIAMVVAPEPAVIVASPPLDAKDCDPGVAVETKSTAAAKAVEASPPPPALEITLTRLTKKGGPFTKKISLAANGIVRE